jgi:hypothetical protein
LVNVVVALDFLGRNFSAPGPGVLYAPINITVHSLVSGDKIYDAQTLFVALLLNVIKIFCLDLYTLGASVLKHLIILECPISGHLTQFIFCQIPTHCPHPYPPGLILIGALY